METINSKITLLPGDTLKFETVITNENIQETEKTQRTLVKTADEKLFMVKIEIKIKEL